MPKNMTLGADISLIISYFNNFCAKLLCHMVNFCVNLVLIYGPTAAVVMCVMLVVFSEYGSCGLIPGHVPWARAGFQQPDRDQDRPLAFILPILSNDNTRSPN